MSRHLGKLIITDLLSMSSGFELNIKMEHRPKIEKRELIFFNNCFKRV